MLRYYFAVDLRSREASELRFDGLLHFGKRQLFGDVQLDNAGLDGLPIILSQRRGFSLSANRRRTHGLHIRVADAVVCWLLLG